MQFLKTMSIKTRYLIFYIFMTLCGICAAVEILADAFLPGENNPFSWLLIPAIGFFIIGFVFRLTMVKCPFCGEKLMEHKKAPDVCPACRESAWKRYDPKALPASEETEQ